MIVLICITEIRVLQNAGNGDNQEHVDEGVQRQKVAGKY